MKLFRAGRLVRKIQSVSHLILPAALALSSCFNACRYQKTGSHFSATCFTHFLTRLISKLHITVLLRTLTFSDRLPGWHMAEYMGFDLMQP